MNATKTPEQMIGSYVYFVRRPGREDGTVQGGTVTRVDEHRRLVVQTDDGPRVWHVDQVTTDISLA